LRGYFAARTAATDPPHEAAASLPARGPAVHRDAKPRVAGVHSRWPTTVVVLLLLLGAAVYSADRSGRIRLRNLTDGWLTPARMSADVPSRTLHRGYDQLLPQARSSTLHAARERETTTEVAPEVTPEVTPTAPAAMAPTSTEEIARKQAAYDDYLKSQGLTRLPEVDAPSDPYDEP